MIPLPPAFLARPLAHRALHGAGRPENSRAAIDAAIAGDYGIEIDLQLSADGIAMVFHDETLDRMTPEVGLVRARKATELAAIPLGSTAETIPTFAEVLTQVAGRAPLLVELKDQTGSLGASDGALEAAVVRASKGYEGPLAFMSFNPSVVANLREHAPGIPRGLTTAAFDPAHWPDVPAARAAALAEIGDLDLTRSSFISHDARDLPNPRVAALRARGVPVLCWTIRSAQAEAAARAHADNVTFEGYTPA